MHIFDHWSTYTLRLYFEPPLRPSINPIFYFHISWILTLILIRTPGPTFSLWCGSGSSFPQWCGSASATLFSSFSSFYDLVLVQSGFTWRQTRDGGWWLLLSRYSHARQAGKQLLLLKVWEDISHAPQFFVYALFEWPDLIYLLMRVTIKKVLLN